jgi:L-iditol 2-dehydrogenase
MMRRYELTGRAKLELNKTAPVPRAGPGQVLIRVGACTICNRSDLVYYHYLGRREHCAQGCFGHEIAGTVESAGPGVTKVVPGDRVFVRTPLTSGYAEFAVAREVAVGFLPDQTGFEQGAILQLLPLAVHATRGVRLGDRVAILGQGPVGLMALQVTSRRGAAEIVTGDLDGWRLERSAALGATRAVLLADRAEPGWARLGGDFDVAIDAVGTPHTANACAGLVRQGGLVVFLGTHHLDTSVRFDLIAWERKGLRVHTAAEPTDLDRAAAMTIAQRLAPAIRLAPLLSEVYPLDRLPEAIERLSASSLLYPAAEPSPYRGPPPRTLKLAITP